MRPVGSVHRAELGTPSRHADPHPGARSAVLRVSAAHQPHGRLTCKRFSLRGAGWESIAANGGHSGMLQGDVRHIHLCSQPAPERPQARM